MKKSPTIWKSGNIYGNNMECIPFPIILISISGLTRFSTNCFVIY
ncbi:hypothetical protein Gohar_027351, partial [Gossypium harknessii]|nr:hypothetical protein [Gossypium harknessii]